MVNVYPQKDTYPEVDYVTLTAVPSAGYVFDSWSGQTEGIADLHQNPVTFQMGDDPDNNRVMTANFLPYAYPRWDINQDGCVNFLDLALLGMHWKQTTTPPYPRWDINQDGIVNFLDLALLGMHWKEGCQ